jgi:hypothetical protein
LSPSAEASCVGSVFSFWVVPPDAPADGAIEAAGEATPADEVGVVGVLELLHAVRARADTAIAVSAAALILVFMELLVRRLVSRQPDERDLTSG